MAAKAAVEFRRIREDPHKQQGVLKVNKFRLSAVLVVAALALSVFAVEAAAQGGGAQAASRPAADFALIDVGAIFKKHELFKRQMADLNADMQRAEAEMKQQADALRAFKEKTSEYKAGTPEYRDAEAQLAEKSANLNVRFQLQKKDFAKAEAKIYFRVYQEIHAEVDAYARATGVAAVLKFSSEQADIENPESVLRELNKPVIWYAQNVDITQLILDSLNQRATQRGDTRQGPVGLPPR